jgi:mRNA-degrading endonuclease RelE of RelBE toxin-antitoxin system
LPRGCPSQIAAAVWEFLRGPLLVNPRRVGEPLRFQLEGFLSARRGQYRVTYRIVEDEVIVEVVKISHRNDAYG